MTKDQIEMLIDTVGSEVIDSLESIEEPILDKEVEAWWTDTKSLIRELFYEQR